MKESSTTKRKQKLRQKGLKTGSDKPKEVGFLNEQAQEVYDDLVDILTKLGVIDQADSVSMYIFADSLAEYIKCAEFLQENGCKYETYTREGEIRYVVYPEVQTKSKAFDRLRNLIPQFYLTPSTRLKVILDDEEKKDSPLAQLLGSGRN